jgi:hypothetical protein
MLAAAGRAAWSRVLVTQGAAQLASVFTQFAHGPGRRRIQPQVGEDLLDDRPLQGVEI